MLELPGRHPVSVELSPGWSLRDRRFFVAGEILNELVFQNYVINTNSFDMFEILFLSSTCMIYLVINVFLLFIRIILRDST